MPNNASAAKNLKPFKSGQSGNPKGRPKGSRNWSTIVQNILGDEALADSLVTKKPVWWGDLPDKNLASAIVAAVAVKAVNGDVQAATWLRATGYGNKLELSDVGREERPIFFIDLDPPALKAKRRTNKAVA